jgi:glyoxylase-like metal-dependent hydrolase (beta-lactamase superfamily II)
VKTSSWRFSVFSVIAAFLAVSAAAAPLEIARGVWLLRGELVPGRQPDGNSVVFATRDGLVVVDTGRHQAHTQAVLDFAGRRRISAIVNTHWHLDHIGGNALMRRARPDVRIYASDAFEGALTGFLANYAGQLEGLIAKTTGEEQQRYRTELALIRSGRALGPDVVVTGSRRLGSLQIHLVKDAVTAGDLWLFDPKTKTLVAGDLVTLPVPFLDTAKPKGWQTALAELAAVPFRRLVPGHGPVMTREEFSRYRTGYDDLLACAASSRTNEVCASGWLTTLGTLVPQKEHDYARQALHYYLDQHLRPHQR